MNLVISAMWERLKEDTALDALLARSVITPSEPGVYTTMPVPQNAALPYVVIVGPISDVPDDTFDAEYRRMLYDLHCYAPRPDGGGGSMALVDNIAERVRALLHRQPLILTGSPRNLVCEISGVVSVNDPAAFGRVVMSRLLVGM